MALRARRDGSLARTNRLRLKIRRVFSQLLCDQLARPRVSYANPSPPTEETESNRSAVCTLQSDRETTSETVTCIQFR